MSSNSNYYWTYSVLLYSNTSSTPIPRNLAIFIAYSRLGIALPFSIFIRVRTFISAPSATCRWVKPRLVRFSFNRHTTVSSPISATFLSSILFLLYQDKTRPKILNELLSVIGIGSYALLSETR